jgi:hypothetical protein
LVQDVPKSKFADDTASHAAQDLATTAGASDFPTLGGGDQLVTASALDVPHKLKFFDDVSTRPTLDTRQPAYGGGAFQRDPRDTDPRMDLKYGPDGLFRHPYGQPAAAGYTAGRPFVLSTPHHAMGWAGEGAAQQPQLADYEAALLQLGETIAQYQQALQGLDAEYQQMLEQYRQAGGAG